MDVKLYLIVVWVCIFLMTNNVMHLLMFFIIGHLYIIFGEIFIRVVIYFFNHFFLFLCILDTKLVIYDLQIFFSYPVDCVLTLDHVLRCTKVSIFKDVTFIYYFTAYAFCIISKKLLPN